MAKIATKITSVMSEQLIFVFLAIFPLGQLIRLSLTVFGVKIAFHPIDLVAGCALLLFLFSKVREPKIFKHISSFLAATTFSLLFSLTIFDAPHVLIGGLYLLRFFAYASFFIVTWNVMKTKKKKTTLFHSLILVCVLTGIFGWIQYFWLPDLTSLKFLGWDDHLYRLAGTFLDPGFTGIILVLGFLASLANYLDKGKRKILLILPAFFLLSIAFTYARASYVALIFGSVLLLPRKLGMKNGFWVFFLFLLILLLLPRPGSEGVKLERLHSVYARAVNYAQTVNIAAKHPLFGVGFNNICPARIKYYQDAGYESHSCAGSDSSLLFVAATTGVIGLLIFLNLSLQVLRGVKKNLYGITFLACSGALFFNSLFVNSLFYPWVMGWMGILLALALKNSKS